MNAYTAIQALNDGLYEVEFWDGRNYGVSTYNSIEAAWAAFQAHTGLTGLKLGRLSFAAPVQGVPASWLR